MTLKAETITATSAALTVSGTTSLDADATGTITLDNTAHDFGGSVTITNALNATIDDTDDITFGAVTTQNNFTVDAGGAVALNGTTSVGGNLDVQANANNAAGGAISGSGAIGVAGTTTLETGSPTTVANDVTLTNVLNDFVGAVTVTSADDVSLVDATSISVASITAELTVALTALAGSIVDHADDALADITSTNDSLITLTASADIDGPGRMSTWIWRRAAR